MSFFTLSMLFGDPETAYRVAGVTTVAIFVLALVTLLSPRRKS